MILSVGKDRDDAFGEEVDRSVPCTRSAKCRARSSWLSSGRWRICCSRATQHYSERQVAIFNDVIGCLVEKVDRQALLELTGRLAAADHAPNPVINRLSNNDDIAVAGQVLEKSNVLTDENLVEIARTKGLEHLLAIAARAQVSETVTDALVERGHAHVTQKVVSNNGARLSELGFVKVVHEARTDEALASTLATERTCRRSCGHF